MTKYSPFFMLVLFLSGGCYQCSASAAGPSSELTNTNVDQATPSEMGGHMIRQGSVTSFDAANDDRALHEHWTAIIEGFKRLASSVANWGPVKQVIDAGRGSKLIRQLVKWFSAEKLNIESIVVPPAAETNIKNIAKPLVAETKTENTAGLPVAKTNVENIVKQPAPETTIVSLEDADYKSKVDEAIGLLQNNEKNALSYVERQIDPMHLRAAWKALLIEADMSDEESARVKNLIEKAVAEYKNIYTKENSLAIPSYWIEF
uniref:Uncharacterized protein n=1 Tax=Peronospora matthiolae TaxID=2874970 RepID=A0AAV1UDC2_9STRA